MVFNKTCWNLHELANRWSCTEEDLIWKAIENKLFLSVWCNSLPIMKSPRPKSGYWRPVINHRTKTPKVFIYNGWAEIPGEDEAARFLYSDEASVCGFVLDFGKTDAVVVVNSTKEVPIENRPNVTNYEWVGCGLSSNHVHKGQLRVRTEEVNRMENEHPELRPCGETLTGSNDLERKEKPGLPGPGLSSDVTVTLPHTNKALDAIFQVMRENWGANYNPKYPPKQTNVAYEIDTALQCGSKGDKSKDPSRNAKAIAALIKPDREE